MANSSSNFDLFECLEGGGLTEEQWEEFKKLRELAGNLVINSSDDSDNSDVIVDDAHSEAGPSRSQENEDSLAADTELTMKYLQGELSFSEFSDLCETKLYLEKCDPAFSSQESQRYEHDDGFEVELEFEKKLKKQRKRGRRSRLPKNMVGLMGQANLCFARGQQEDAIKMCMEIIRQAPYASEPFQTLGILYEELGDMEKSLQFYLIAAHLGPNDIDEWVRLAILSLEQGNIKSAITCYDKAIKLEPNNIELLHDRCSLYQKVNDWKKVLESCQAILKALPPDEGEEYLRTAQEIAKLYHDNGEDNLAVDIMKQAFEVHPASLTSEDVNMFLELLLSLKLYSKCVEVLCEHCGVVFYQSGSKPIELSNLSFTDDNTKPTSCSVPDVLPIDLRIKLVISLIYLRCFDPAKEALQVLYQENLEDMGDLFFDVAEAYMDLGEYKEALPALTSLVNSKKYNLAAIWLRHGECLNALGNIQSAVESYRHVVELAPSHLEARVALSTLFQQQGKLEEALETVTQNSITTDNKEVSEEEMQLTLHRCTLLHSQGLFSEFIDASKCLLARIFKDIHKPNHLAAISRQSSLKYRKEAIIQLLGVELKNFIPSVTTGAEGSPSLDDLWDLYVKVCDTLAKLKRFSELEVISIAALTSSQFMTSPLKVKEIEFICMMGCYFNKNYDFAFNFIKDICIKYFSSNENDTKAWNFFNQIITFIPHIRYNRYCMRLIVKKPDHYALEILNGNNCMISGTYKHSLGEYAAAYKQNSKDPMLCLCMGLTFIHMASQKFSSKKHSLTIQGCAFLHRYLKFRGECQETFYNIGRAMHQLGLFHAAIYYYKRALEFPSPIQDETIAEIYDLKHEIAFNLSLIYQSSGSKLLARQLIQKYLIT